MVEDWQWKWQQYLAQLNYVGLKYILDNNRLPDGTALVPQVRPLVQQAYDVADKLYALDIKIHKEPEGATMYVYATDVIEARQKANDSDYDDVVYDSVQEQMWKRMDINQIYLCDENKRSIDPPRR